MRPFRTPTLTTVFIGAAISALADYKRGHVRSVDTGRVTFQGIPFDLPAPARAAMTEGPFVPTTTSLGVGLRIARPTSVYILLSGAYVKRQFTDKRVGTVKLRVADGSENEQIAQGTRPALSSAGCGPIHLARMA